MKPKKELSHPIHPLLEKRWSPRAFEPKAIGQETVDQLFEAARWSPSAFNEQPWHFIYAERGNADAFKNVHECLNEGNRSWTANASLLIITFAKNFYERNGKTNAHASHDLGGAAANLTLQALDLDLYVHQMAGIDKKAILEKFDIPDGWEPMTMIAVGYLGDVSTLDERQAASEFAEQKRKSIEEIASLNKW
ncbi:MAG: nitroreductase family protein [Vicingaceae bacterium]